MNHKTSPSQIQCNCHWLLQIALNLVISLQILPQENLWCILFSFLDCECVSPSVTLEIVKQCHSNVGAIIAFKGLFWYKWPCTDNVDCQGFVTSLFPIDCD